MNSKKAKALRRTAKLAGAPVDTVYTESNDVLWGPLPTVKGPDGKYTDVIDKKRLNKALDNIPNAKFKNVTLKAGPRSTKLAKELRYVAGIPAKLGLCERMIYKKLKASAVG